MWWKILIGFFVLKSISQPTAPAPLPNPDIGTFRITGGGPIITTPLITTTPLPNPDIGTFRITGGGPIITTPMITSPLFDNTGATKIMQTNPAFGGSKGFQF